MPLFLRATNISRIVLTSYRLNLKIPTMLKPFVVTYSLALPRISNILPKQFNILHSSNRCKDVFKQPPFVAYRRSSNLRDLLVKAQLPVISNNHFLPCQASSAVDRIVPLVHTLLKASQVITFMLQVKHAPSLYTLLVTLKT